MGVRMRVLPSSKGSIVVFIIKFLHYLFNSGGADVKVKMIFVKRYLFWQQVHQAVAFCRKHLIPQGRKFIQHFCNLLARSVQVPCKLIDNGRGAKHFFDMEQHR